jgi:TRAP-type uncharacterized transport system substrate-binding protein
MKRLLVIILLSIVVFSLVLAGCSSSAPAPSPSATTKPATAPATSAAPGASAVPSSTQAAVQHAPVTLRLYAHPSGGMAYVINFALSDIVNKNSKWLKINPMESTGALENIKAIMDNPDKKDVYFGASTTMGVDQLALGVAPFDKLGPASPVKWLSVMANISSCIVTLDPNIKSPADLAGKKFGLDTMGSSDQYVEEWLMQYAWNVKDKVKVTYGNTADVAVDRLMDGTIDVTWQGAMALGDAEYKDWAPMPSFERLLAAKKVYFLDVPAADMDVVRKQTKIDSLAVLGCQDKTVGKTDATKFHGIRNTLGWVVPNNMDEAIVNELINIIYAHAGEFATYHTGGKAITQASLGSIPVSKDAYHPAVVKFLESKGLKVGR